MYHLLSDEGDLDSPEQPLAVDGVLLGQASDAAARLGEAREREHPVEGVHVRGGDAKVLHESRPPDLENRGPGHRKKVGAHVVMKK